MLNNKGVNWQKKSCIQLFDFSFRIHFERFAIHFAVRNANRDPAETTHTIYIKRNYIIINVALHLY